MTLNYKLIGVRIRNIRLSQELTQETLAELSDISPQHVSHIENSGTKLSLPCLVAICNALKTTPNDILLDSIDNNAPQLSKEIAAAFADCNNDEIFMMLSMVDNFKKSLRLKDLKLTRE